MQAASRLPRVDTPLRDAQVTIVGLGLMGGSLAAALKQANACRRVVGVVRRLEPAAFALEHGWVDEASTNLAETLPEADIVVLATPVRTIVELVPRVGSRVKPGCLVMDLGSTKAVITQALQSLPEHVMVVGGHPMCGKETSGIDAAEPSLFEGQVFVLTPLRRTRQSALSLAHELVEAIGARPLVLEAEEHDHLAATTSHLPYLLACGLVGSAEQVAGDHPLLWQLAAGGFRDTSRLAASSVEMMLDILMTNRDAVLAALGTYEARLGLLARSLRTHDESNLRQLLEAAAARRGSM